MVTTGLSDADVPGVLNADSVWTGYDLAENDDWQMHCQGAIKTLSVL